MHQEQQLEDFVFSCVEIFLFRRNGPPNLAQYIQERRAAPESLVKNNEILRNNQMQSTSNEVTDGDFGNANP
jgi:hypothetical protein